MANVVIIDEAHKVGTGSSDQAIVTRRAARAANFCKPITATSYKGMASSAFHLGWLMSPSIRKSFAHEMGIPWDWINKYGSIRLVYESGAEEKNGRMTRYERRLADQKTKEAPGASNALIARALSYYMSANLNDLGAGALKNFREEATVIEMTDAERSHYTTALVEMQQFVSEMLVGQKDRSPIGAYYHFMRQFPDRMHELQQFKYTKTEGKSGRKTIKREIIPREVQPYPPILSEGEMSSKEKKMVEIVNKHRENDERIILYVSQVDVLDRYHELIEKHCPSAKPWTLPKSISPAMRKEAIEGAVKEGIDVLLVSPRKVTEGVSLLDFNIIVYMETEPSLTTMMQSSRRTHRIPQKKNTTVYYLVWEDRFQAQLFDTYVKRMKAAKLMYGDPSATTMDEADESDAMEGVGEAIFKEFQIDRDKIANTFSDLNNMMVDAYKTSAWYPVNGLRERKDWSQFKVES